MKKNDDYYKQVEQEIKQGEYQEGLRARAIADADGDENKARALYIKFRVESLKAEAADLIRRKEGRTACPACGGSKLIKPNRREKRSLGIFHVLPVRKCGGCGHLWEPPAPAWLLVFGLVGSSIACILGVAPLVMTPPRLYVGSLFFGIAGLVAFIVCLMRLMGAPPPSRKA